MVLTSHDKLGDSGKKTGFWLEEFAAPYYVFFDAHINVVLASPAGGSRRSIRSATPRMHKLPIPNASARTPLLSRRWPIRSS